MVLHAVKMISAEQRADHTSPEVLAYRGTSPVKNSTPLGPYIRNMPRAAWWSSGEVLFLMNGVPVW